MKYYIEKTLNTNFETAVAKVTAALEKESFGIVSEINLHEKFKEKLGVEFRKYRILGACNPSLSYQSLQKEDKIGTMLPCNVIVQQLDDNKVEVAAVDPVASMHSVENSELHEIINDAKNRMDRVISSLS
ncbi:MAG: hypothetical protein C0593_08960 [Marinilabiliales bacterium]|nr:MAG: hypothetical protein C0593_08960 [Marinilabiliales bacterium]